MEGFDESMRKGDHSIIGRLYMDCFFGKEVLGTTMAKIWKISKPAMFQECGQNMFVITFATHAKKEKVLAGRPWLFDNCLLVLKIFDGFMPLS